ncbi:hypothetical protein [Paenibacillus tepidiphilus]|uniref:hypothetical protein n=1 Tax=Paenibacillus tepidiphilus TaxID=2608683 RepID=UPI00123A7248|nr:hypothetical protein [Paenibacillus tepidiphilus]
MVDATTDDPLSDASKENQAAGRLHPNFRPAWLRPERREREHQFLMPAGTTSRAEREVRLRLKYRECKI